MVNGAGATAVLVALAVLTMGALARLRSADAELQAAAFTRAQALAAAAVEAARAEHVLWLNTEFLLARAARRARSGDTPSALRLARAARHEAELARNQARLEAARYGLALGRAKLAAPARTALERVLHAHDGRAALALARRFGLVD